MRSTWTLFLLAAQPELQEEMAAEATAALGRWQSTMRRSPIGCRGFA